METTKEVLQSKLNAAQELLYMALELSNSKWRLALSSGGSRMSHYVIEAGNRAELLAVIEKARRGYGLLGPVKVMSC